MNSNYLQSIKVLHLSSQFVSYEFLYIAKGDVYKAIKNYSKAEKMYQFASNIVPSRFFSQYLLAKLYQESLQTDKLLVQAKSLQHKKVKVHSLVIDDMKNKMQKIIKTYERE